MSSQDIKYPWYEIVSGGQLEQGDLLQACPVPMPVGEWIFPLTRDDVSVVINTPDVVVMTQSCDLAHDKAGHVTLCPHWDLVKVARADPALARPEVQQEILKGRRPRYVLLAASSIPSMPMGIRLVDLGRVFSLPQDFVSKVAEHQSSRLRLFSPYREYLSQAFARFFMRVALPEEGNIKLGK